MHTFKRKAEFERGQAVSVAVYEPTDHDLLTIILGIRPTGGEFQTIGLDRDMAKRLRDLLDAAITVDEACFLRRPQVIVEGPGDDDEPLGSHDLSDDGEALASAGWGTDEDYGG
jgi:hypothetical protein